MPIPPGPPGSVALLVSSPHAATTEMLLFTECITDCKPNLKCSLNAVGCDQELCLST